jgi:inhibitor of cysteine peptidase
LISIRRFNLSELTLREADGGKTLAVQLGDTIAICLPENPTTGYRWAIDQTDSQILALQNSLLALATEAGIGAGGMRTLIFQAKTPGTVQLRLKNWRDWQGDDSVIDRFEVAIQVRQ